MKALILLSFFVFPVLLNAESLDEAFGSKEKKEALFKEVDEEALKNAKLKFCNKDWEKSYLSFMKAQRNSGKYTEKQIAFIGGFHGGMLGKNEDHLKSSGFKCK